MYCVDLLHYSKVWDRSSGSSSSARSLCGCGGMWLPTSGGRNPTVVSVPMWCPSFDELQSMTSATNTQQQSNNSTSTTSLLRDGSVGTDGISAGSDRHVFRGGRTLSGVATYI